MIFQLLFARKNLATQPQVLGVGIVDEEIRPREKGRVKFRATWWDARCEADIVLPQGTPVQIVRKEIITLFVVPIENR
ncbi:MAG: NfeD family protein [Microcoleaceae cyanobacterium]